MKKHILFFLLIFTSPLFAQQTIIDDSVVLKRGIYQTFEEFKFNRPSIICDFEVDSFPILSSVVPKKTHTSYRIVMDEELAKTIHNDFGFCDGKSVFIKLQNMNITGTQQANKYNKFIELGVYSYFNEAYSSKNIYGGVAGAVIADATSGKTEFANEINTQVIDLNTGEVFTLNQENLKIALQRDKELQSLFVNNIQSPLIDFLQRYNHQHKTDGIYILESKMTISEANAIIKKYPIDSTIEAYLRRIYSRFSKNDAFRQVIIDRKNHSNGTIKSLGISLQHNFNGIEEYRYKVGTWYYCYEDGSLKEEIEYDIDEKKLNSTKYNKEGNLIK